MPGAVPPASSQWEPEFDNRIFAATVFWGIVGLIAGFYVFGAFCIMGSEATGIRLKDNPTVEAFILLVLFGVLGLVFGYLAPAFRTFWIKIPANAFLFVVFLPVSFVMTALAYLLLFIFIQMF